MSPLSSPERLVFANIYGWKWSGIQRELEQNERGTQSFYIGRWSSAYLFGALREVYNNLLIFTSDPTGNSQ